jgi:hypothetical protein
MAAGNKYKPAGKGKGSSSSSNETASGDYVPSRLDRVAIAATKQVQNFLNGRKGGKGQENKLAWKVTMYRVCDIIISRKLHCTMFVTLLYLESYNVPCL